LRRPGAFRPGEAANPRGRPRGSRTRLPPALDAALRKLAQREARVILETLLAATRGGDAGAAAALLGAMVAREAEPRP
jgi:hypothetical protein